LFGRQKNVTKESYREHFVTESSAMQYETEVYATNSWSTLVWTVEQEILAEILDNANFVPNRKSYVDFACGTGRLTAFFSHYFQSTIGIDISEAMLKVARERTEAVRFLRADLTQGDEILPEPADLITAFRFFLNAEPNDRTRALQWMRSQLRDEDSRIILNNHANLWSHKALPHAIRRAIRVAPDVTANVMSHRAIVKLTSDAGLNIEEIHGTGFMGGHAAAWMSFDRMLSVQRKLGRSRWLQRLGEDQIYVLRPR
jgi:SAM-dependent methyltransferase